MAPPPAPPNMVTSCFRKTKKIKWQTRGFKSDIKRHFNVNIKLLKRILFPPDSTSVTRPPPSSQGTTSKWWKHRSVGFFEREQLHFSVSFSLCSFKVAAPVWHYQTVWFLRESNLRSKILIIVRSLIVSSHLVVISEMLRVSRSSLDLCVVIRPPLPFLPRWPVLSSADSPMILRWWRPPPPPPHPPLHPC